MMTSRPSELHCSIVVFAWQLLPNAPSAVQVDCYCCLCFYYCPSLIIFLLPHRIFAKWLGHAGNLFLAADRPFRLFVLFLFSLVVFTPELQRPLVRVDCCFCFSHVDDLAYLTVVTRWPHGLADLTVASFLHDNCCRTGWLLLFFKYYRQKLIIFLLPHRIFLNLFCSNWLRRRPFWGCGAAFQIIRSLFIFPFCLYSGGLLAPNGSRSFCHGLIVFCFSHVHRFSHVNCCSC